MKKGLFFVIPAVLLLCFAGCGETKMLHCDKCGKEVEVQADSNMEEDWTLFCEDCHEKLFGEEGLVKPN